MNHEELDAAVHDILLSGAIMRTGTIRLKLARKHIDVPGKAVYFSCQRLSDLGMIRQTCVGSRGCEWQIVEVNG